MGMWYRLYNRAAWLVWKCRVPDWLAVPVLDWLERRVR